MLYTFKQNQTFLNSIEYSVAYHCNLRCTQCSHLSPFMRPEFPSVESFKEDLFRLSEVMHAKVIRLLGGEPLLNPDIDRFVVIAKQSGIADVVAVTTNGLLLHRMSESFWKNVDYVLVSLYPGIELKESYTTFKERAKSYNTRIWFQIVSRFRITIVSAPHKKDWITSLIYHSCKDVHFYHCHMIHEGMLYKCAVPPFLGRYSAQIKQDYDPIPDGLSIHNHSNLHKDLRSYLADRRSTEACRYCLGYIGKRIPHTQVYPNSGLNDEKISVTRRNSLDFRRLFKNACGLFYRRFAERLTGKQRW